MNRTCLRNLVPIGVVFMLASGSAGAENFALGFKAGTAGLGLEATWRVTESVNVRTGYYAFDFSADMEEEGIEYDGDLKLRNLGLFADWHPFRGRFRVTGGGVQSGNEFRGSADGELDVGDNTYNAVVDAKIGWRGFAPYLGIGFGNAVRSRWTFSFDLGVMFTGSPGVQLEGAVNDSAVEQAFREDLAREEANLRDELSDAKYYPVIALGAAFRF